MRTTGVFGVASRTRWRNGRLLILCYHGVAQEDEHQWDPALYMTPALLTSRLAFLKDRGFTILALEDALDRMRAGRLPERSVALTFDDGYVDFYRLAHPILQSFGAPATVYLTTSCSEKGLPPPGITANYMLWKRADFQGRLTVLPGIDEVNLRDAASRQAVTRAATRFFAERRISGQPKHELLEKFAEELGFDFAEFRRKRLLHLLSPDEGHRLASAGVDIQMHTHRHFVPQDEGMVRREVLDNRERIEAITGRPAVHFCYPSGVSFPEMLPWLRKLNVRSATTCDLGLASASDDPLLLPRFLDHSGVSPVEFEAWVSGVGSMLPRRVGRPA